MRALILSLILFLQLDFASASKLTDTAKVFSDTSAIVVNQPDSITKKVVFLLIEAADLRATKPAAALKNYQKALQINKVKDPIWEANIRLAMGRLLFRLKNTDAIPQLLKADALYKKKLHLAGRTDAMTEIAKVQEAGGLATEALKTYNDLYKIQYKGGEFTLAGNTASLLTDDFLKKKNYPEALKYAEMAKKAYYTVCRKDSLGSTFYKIAYIKRKQNSPKQAEHYILNEALSYYRSSADLEGRLKSFDFLGSLYLDQKRYSQAKWFYLQANNQARLINDTESIIRSLINLGVTKILIGDLVLAKLDIAEAESIIQIDSAYAPIMKKAKIKYASLFKKLDKPVLATNVTKKAIITAEKPKSPIKKPKPAVKPASVAVKSGSVAGLSTKDKKDSDVIVEAENK